MPLADTLLFPVFEYLQRQGLPLGISEYLAAVDAVQHGYGLEDEDHLRGLCRLLWAKSVEELGLVDFALSHALHPQTQGPKAALSPETPTIKGTTPPPIQPDKTESTGSGKRPATQADQKTTRPAPAPPTFQTVDMPLLAGLQDAPDQKRFRYNLTPRLPIDRREMATAWRSLRRLQRSGPAEELDVQATIDDYCQRGFFFGPHLVPRRRNQADLLALVDQDGSMAPFSPLVDQLVGSILRGSRLDQVSIYYFHDCPDTVLFKQPELLDAVKLEETLGSEAVGRGVLIISDAGAARGEYEDRRVKCTRDFIQILATYSYQIAWLNPMPGGRWLGTTAESIAGFVPMFPINRDGLTDAVNLLRGQPLAAPTYLYERSD